MTQKAWKLWKMSLIKSTISHKLRIIQKKSFVWKIIVTSIPIFPAKNYAKPKKLFFVEWVALWWPITQKLKIGKFWNMIIHSIQHIPHLLCKDGYFWRWGGFAYPSLWQGENHFCEKSLSDHPHLPCKFDHFWPKNIFVAEWVALGGNNLKIKNRKNDFLFDSAHSPSFM